MSELIAKAILDANCEDLSPYEKFLLVTIAMEADPNDYSCDLSTDYLIQRTRMARSTIKRCMVQLVKMSYVTKKYQTRKDGGCKSNRYIINNNMINKDFCVDRQMDKM